MNSSTIDWESGPRAGGGIDPAPLECLAERAAEERPWLNSLLVVRHGRLLFERYFNGFGPENLHPVYSVTKQWLSCLVGIALEKGLLPSLDMPLAGYHGSRAPRGSDPRKRMITLRHCLAMQSGLGWRNDMDFATAFSRAADPVAFFFGDDIDVVEVPGTAWVYSACDSQMVAETLRTAIGRPLTEAAREWLADPLGITEFKWPRTISIPGAATWRAEIGPSEMWLSPRGLARLGFCLLNHGSQGGRQVVPRRWLELATAPTPGVDGPFLQDFYAQIGVPPVRGMSGYGLHFGLKDFDGHPVISVAGSGGQYAFVVRDLDLLIVQTAGLAPGEGDAVPPSQAGLDGGVDIALDVILPALD